MSQIALYRKYRPQNFAEVLGQDHIVAVLKEAAKNGSISHAYLFSGSRGTGKTSVARILAREIGCSPEDIYEIDAASNRRIEDVREIREAVHVLPMNSPYKVYIVDEVHMMTKEAFNALLKTLEEPPKHVIFILATTEVEKLPETVVSRCQSFSFKKPSHKMLKEMSVQIAKKEGKTLEPAAAELIGVLSDGSFRDMHGILEKIMSASLAKKITLEEVEKFTGAPAGRLLNDFLLSIDEKDAQRGLKAVSEAVQKNMDIKIFLRLVLGRMRQVILLRYAPEMEGDIKNELVEEDFRLIKRLSGKKNSGINSASLKEVISAYEATGRSGIAQLPAELSIIKLAQ